MECHSKALPYDEEFVLLEKLLFNFRWETGKRVAEEKTITSIIVLASSEKVWKHLIHRRDEERVVRFMRCPNELHDQQCGFDF